MNLGGFTYLFMPNEIWNFIKNSRLITVMNYTLITTDIYQVDGNAAQGCQVFLGTPYKKIFFFVKVRRFLFKSKAGKEFES